MATLTTSWQLIDQTYLGTSGGNLYVRLYARYSEQDITNNRTYVYYQARSYYENSTYIQDNQGTIAVSGTGASYQSAGCTRPTTGESVSVTTSGWVSHNSDGTGSASGSATINFLNWGWSGTASSSFTLPTIPRASEVACSSPYIGDNAIISIDKKSSAFTNTVTYKIGTLTGTVATKTSSTTLQLNTSAIADQIYALIPNDTEIQGTIYCTTYNGSTQIGNTKSTTFNLYAKESVCKPDVSATIVDINTSVTDITDKFIKYISKPKVTINATAKNSATITNYSINLNDGQTSNLQENTFDTIGSNKVTVSATDSRGYSNSTDVTLDMIDYIKLHINTISITRPEGTSNEAILNCDGAYYNGSFTDEVSNTLTATFKYRLSGATDWTDGGSITPTIENNTFNFFDLSLGESFDYNEEYQFKIILQDKFLTIGSSDADIITLPKGQEVVAIGEDDVWMYGDLWINDIKFSDYFASSFCKMRTNFEYKTINSNSTLLTDWESVFQSGDIVSEPDKNRIKVTNTSCLRLSGQICGAGNCWVRYKICQKVEIGPDLPYTEEEIDDSGMSSLYQLGTLGNGYWSAPLPNVLVSLNKETTYYLYLYVSPYNGENMDINSGFGKKGTYICAEKIK